MKPELIHRRPTKEEIRAAAGKSVPDVIKKGLKLLFVGINPGLYTAAIGHHFGRPGNRFWPVLYYSGFTPRIFSPYEESELLNYGYGITNIVNKATGSADELTPEELARGGQELERKIEIIRPWFVAMLGVGAFRLAFNRPKAQIGEQAESIGGAKLWILPNPSGLNAHYDIDQLSALFRKVRQEIEVDHSRKESQKNHNR